MTGKNTRRGVVEYGEVMFDKPLNQVDKTDVYRLLDEKAIEGVNIEFKESLPTKKGNDPWIEGRNQISDYARNQLLEEVVAFANAYGGILCIGISESEDTPAYAKGINAIPICGDLAERLKLQCRDCIEPQIPLLDAVGVVTDENGGGIVIMQIPQSRLAPHRHMTTKECYIRRADRTEKMTMREIQDLTLHTERSMARIDTSFNDQKSKFEEKLKFFRNKSSQKICGLRITALPTNDINLHSIHRCSDVKQHIPTFKSSFDGQNDIDLTFPFNGDVWKPILRGTYTESSEHTDYFFSTELLSNGLVELTLFIKEDQHGHIIYPNWFVGMVCNSLNYLHRIRKATRTPSVEYALEIQINNVEGPLRVGGYNNNYGFIRCHGTIGETNVTFPRYSVGTADSFQELCSIVETDFWNHCGVAWEGNIQIDFEQLQ